MREIIYPEFGHGLPLYKVWFNGKKPKPFVPKTKRNSAKNDLVINTGTSLFEAISLEYWANNTHHPFDPAQLKNAYGVIAIKDKKYTASDDDALVKHWLLIDELGGIPHIILDVKHSNLQLAPGKYYYSINLVLPAWDRFPLIVDQVIRGKLKVKASTITEVKEEI